MRLSEAIRLGAMVRPQGFGELFTMRDGQLASCAFGAADEALTDDDSPLPSCDDSDVSVVYAMYPFVETKYVKCPASCFFKRGRVDDIVHHLNDDHKWTREAIADFIETIEPPEEPLTIERAHDEEYAWVQTTSAPRAD